MYASAARRALLLVWVSLGLGAPASAAVLFYGGTVGIQAEDRFESVEVEALALPFSFDRTVVSEDGRTRASLEVDVVAGPTGFALRGRGSAVVEPGGTLAQVTLRFEYCVEDPGGAAPPPFSRTARVAIAPAIGTVGGAQARYGGGPLGGIVASTGGAPEATLDDDGTLPFDPECFSLPYAVGGDIVIGLPEGSAEPVTAEFEFEATLGEATLPPPGGTEHRWVGRRSGVFADAESWDPPSVPGSSDTAVFDGGGRFNIDFAPTPVVASRLAPRGPQRREIGRIVVQRGDVQAFDAELQLIDPSAALPSLVVESGGTLLLGAGADVVAQDVRVGAGSSLELLDAFQLGCNELVLDNGGRIEVQAGLLTCASIDATNGGVHLEGSAARLFADRFAASGITVFDGAMLETETAVLDAPELTEDQPFSPLGNNSEGGSEVPSSWTTGTLTIGRQWLSLYEGFHLSVRSNVFVGDFGELWSEDSRLEVGGNVEVGGALVGGGLKLGEGDSIGEALRVRGSVVVADNGEPEPARVRRLDLSDGYLQVRSNARLETTTNAFVAAAAGENPRAFVGTPIGGGQGAVWTVLGTLDLSGEGVPELQVVAGALLEAGDLVIGDTGVVGGQGTVYVRGTPPFSGFGQIVNLGFISCGILIDGSLLNLGAGRVGCAQSGGGSAPQLNPLSAALPRVGRAKPAAPPDTPLVVTGDASLGGTLVLQFRAGFAPAQGQPLRVLDVGGKVTGSFDEIAVQGLAPGAVFEGALSGGVFTVAATTPTQALPPLALKAKKKLKETKAKGAKVKVTRTGDRSAPLLVSYRVGGTAQPGVDYEALPGTLEIPAGKKSATIALRPLRDGLVEPSETIELELLPGDGYSLPRVSDAAIELLSKDP